MTGTITITPVPTENAGASFAVGGTLTVTPSISFQVDGGTAVSAAANPVTSAWSGTAVAPATPGAHTLSVDDPLTGATASVTVTVATSAPATESPNGTLATPGVGTIESGTGTASGTRDSAHYPGADGRYYALPLQTTAQWITSGAQITSLRKGTPNVRQPTNFCVPWVVGLSTDPECTVSDGTKTITVRIPIGTHAENAGDPGDDSLGGTDSTQPYLGWTANAVLIDGAAGNATKAGSVITCAGLQVYDCTGPVMEDAFTGMTTSVASDNAIGNIPEFELLAAIASPTYVIPHTIMCSLDATQLNTAGPAVWPVSSLDTGGSGPIPEGVTVGIPSTTARPTGQTRGFYLLWDSLQQFGMLTYNGNGSGAISCETYPVSTATKALSTDMNASFPAVMAHVCILAHDGTSGSQTGPSTAKGMVGGVRADAFPAPALINYSATGGSAVTPSSFGAWYATGLGQFYNTPSVAPPASTQAVTINSAGIIVFGTTPDNTTSNVVELEYWNHIIYQKNMAGNWFSGTAPGGWTQVAVSASGATVTDSTGVILDTAGDLVTLQGGQAYFTGAVDTTTANVITLLWFNSALYQENSADNWWVGTKGSWTAVSGDPRTSGGGTTGGGGTPTGTFTVSGTQILDPNGNPFVTKGIAIWQMDAIDGGAMSATQNLPLQMFPGLNTVRYTCFESDPTGLPTGASLVSMVNFCTNNGKGPMVISFNHTDLTSPSGSDLTTITNWFSDLATTFKNNPYVWYEPLNEPPTGQGDIPTAYRTIAAAIRAAGATAPIVIQPQGGGTLQEFVSGDLDSITDPWIWSVHFYANGAAPNSDNTNQASVTNALFNGGAVGFFIGVNAVKAFKNKPTIIGEFGSGGAGGSSSIDTGAPQVLVAVETGVNNGQLCGCWLWEIHDEGGGPGDNAAGVGGFLSASNNTLTDYGAGYASWLATGVPSGRDGDNLV